MRLTSYIDIQIALQKALEGQEEAKTSVELLEQLVEHMIEQSKIYPLDRGEARRNYRLYQQLKIKEVT